MMLKSRAFATVEQSPSSYFNCKRNDVDGRELREKAIESLSYRNI